jgi:hypothetical protein
MPDGSFRHRRPPARSAFTLALLPPIAPTQTRHTEPISSGFWTHGRPELMRMDSVEAVTQLKESRQAEGVLPRADRLHSPYLCRFQWGIENRRCTTFSRTTVSRRSRSRERHIVDPLHAKRHRSPYRAGCCPASSSPCGARLGVRVAAVGLLRGPAIGCAGWRGCHATLTAGATVKEGSTRVASQRRSALGEDGCRAAESPTGQRLQARWGVSVEPTGAGKYFVWHCLGS